MCWRDFFYCISKYAGKAGISFLFHVDIFQVTEMLGRNRPVALWFKPTVFFFFFIFFKCLNLCVCVCVKQTPYISVVKSVSLAVEVSPGRRQEKQTSKKCYLNPRQVKGVVWSSVALKVHSANSSTTCPLARGAQCKEPFVCLFFTASVCSVHHRLLLI